MSDVIKFIFYSYKPSMAGAVIFILLFTISADVSVKHPHLSYLIVARTDSRMLVEAVGYIGRALSSTESPDFTKNPYIIQSVLLLLGPTLYAASIYMILGRLVVLLEADNYSLIRPKWLTKFFVLGDVLSFFAQGGGGGMLTTAKSQDDVRRGENIILGGLGIQIIFFGFFIIVTAVFHRRIRNEPTPKSSRIVAPWKSLLYTLYGTSMLIMIRSIYRVAEYAEGQSGELQSKEFWLYIFDAFRWSLLPLPSTGCTRARWSAARPLSRHRTQWTMVSRIQGSGANTISYDSSPSYPGSIWSEWEEPSMVER
ncbi:putative RTA1 like protein-domain-containing protein [Seiridium cardinale]|uniref:RTA1 like protein-domain-containing protein n=1 Tax=Seiridium cardinale TaxID=138064 RepID=A0ABR2X6T3_9PEZI